LVDLQKQDLLPACFSGRKGIEITLKFNLREEKSDIVLNFYENNNQMPINLFA